VLGNFKGLGEWDEAVIMGVQPDGLYKLDYTDEGLIEENVPASRIRRAGPNDQAAPLSVGVGSQATQSAAVGGDIFQEGEEVLGNFKGLGEWDEAVIMGVQPNGLYTLDYTDEGLIEDNVPVSRIRRVGLSSLAAQVSAPSGAGPNSQPMLPVAVLADTFREGEEVLGNFQGLGEWDEAVVMGVQPNGLYTLDYVDDGLIEENVPSDRIKRVGDAVGSQPPQRDAVTLDQLLSSDLAGRSGPVGSALSRGGAGEEGVSEESEEDSEEKNIPFIKSSIWRGQRAGYVFKRGVLADGAQGVGYFLDVPLHVKHEEEERERMCFSAAQLANWMTESVSEPPSLAKADRCFNFFQLESLRVGTLDDKASKPLFGSLVEWFEAERELLASKLSHESVQVHLRVFLEPQQALRQGLQHPSFAIDWMSVSREADVEPISSAILRKMGMEGHRPKRMLLVVMYRAERSRITHIWAEMDREGLALNKKAQLEDVLISDAFDRALNIARRAGATGELNPQFSNYYQIPVIG